MASESVSAAPRSLGRIVTYRNGNMTLFIPFVLHNHNNTVAAAAAEAETSNNNSSSEDGNADTRVVVLINPSNRTYTVLQSVTELNTFLADLQTKATGTPPASMASIESLPMIENDDDDCPICLDVMNRSKVMPCKHMFHNTCLEKWLRIHGSCPVCRFTMPVELEEWKDDNNGTRSRRVRVIYVLVSVERFGNLRSNQETS